MERNTHQFNYAAARAVAAAALVATIAFASGPVIAAKASAEDRVEARIKDNRASDACVCGYKIARCNRRSRSAPHPDLPARTSSRVAPLQTPRSRIDAMQGRAS